MSLSCAVSALKPDMEPLDGSTGSTTCVAASMDPLRATCVGAVISILIRGPSFVTFRICAQGSASQSLSCEQVCGEQGHAWSTMPPPHRAGASRADQHATRISMLRLVMVSEDSSLPFRNFNPVAGRTADPRLKPLPRTTDRRKRASVLEPIKWTWRRRGVINSVEQPALAGNAAPPCFRKPLEIRDLRP